MTPPPSRNGNTTYLKGPQQLFLLALHPLRGTLRNGNWLPYGLAGAALLELALIGRIQIDRKRLIVIDAAGIGDPLLDQVLSLLLDSKRTRLMNNWVKILGDRKRWLCREVATSLLAHGIIRVERRRLFGVIPYKVYPMADPLPRQKVVDHLRHMLTDGDSVDPRLATVVGVAQSLNLLRFNFPEEDHSSLRLRVKNISRAEQYVGTIAAAVEAVQGAVTLNVATSTLRVNLARPAKK